MIYKINKNILLESLENVENVDHTYDRDPDFEDDLGDFDLQQAIENYEKNQNDPVFVNQQQDDAIFNNSLGLSNQSFDINDIRNRSNVGLGLGALGAGLGMYGLRRRAR